ncbi:hypothetical protein [Paenibacillus sp. GYB003]|uniref:hypothetical protein n=1 Tax=Paenibacillus sp. GYB003 TaxID=2994392 RepID=UPI002F96BC77
MANRNSVSAMERIAVFLSAEKTLVFQANESGHRYLAQHGRKRSGLPEIAILKFVSTFIPPHSALITMTRFVSRMSENRKGRMNVGNSSQQDNTASPAAGA